MTTFAKKTFDAAAYLKNRPTYTPGFINHVIQYARPPPKALALDLGCGPGQATALLAASGSFRKVAGVDPSQGMIDAARSTIKDNPSALLPGSKTSESLAEVEYRTGSAEDLGWIQDSSVDLVTAGQAAHWFDHDEVYKELLRIVKPGGTVAYWGYAYLFLPQFPAASAKVVDFGLKKLGAYWEPGRKGVHSLYDLVPFPSNTDGWDTSSFVRHKFDQTDSEAYVALNGDNTIAPETKHYPIAMGKKLNMAGLASQLKTWSSVHTYMEQHSPEKHIVDEFIEELKKDVQLKEGEEMQVSWPMGLLLMKKAKQ